MDADGRSQTAPGVASFEVSYEHTSELASSVYWASLWHRREVYAVGSILITVLAVGRLAAGLEVPLWTFWLGVVVTLWYVWLAGARQSRGSSRGAVTVHLLVEPSGITARAPGMTVSIAWPEIERIDHLKPALLLRRGGGGTLLAIPSGVLSAEQQALIEASVLKPPAPRGR